MNNSSSVKSINPNTFYKTYIKGEFLFGLWNVVSRGIGFFNTLIILSCLTIYQYGVFQLILTSFSGIAVFIGLGGETIKNDILRYIGEGDLPRAKKLFLESIILNMSIGLLLWAGVFFGAPIFFPNYSLEFIGFIKIISFLFLHDAMLPSFRLILESKRKFNVIASRTSVGRFIQLGIIAYFYFFSVLGLREIILALVISSFITMIFIAVSAFKIYLESWKNVQSVQETLINKLLFSYGKWELMRPITAKTVSFVQVWITKIFIGTEAVAIFSIAQTMLGALTNLFPINTLSTLVPLYIMDNQKLQKIYNVGAKYLTIFSVAIGLVGLIVAPPFIRLFFPKYIESLAYFNGLLITLPIIAISMVAAIFLTVYRRQGFLLVHKILKGIIGIGLYMILVPIFGMWGLVIQSVILLTILYIIMHIYMSKTNLDVYFDWKYFFSFSDVDREFIRNFYYDIRRVIKRWIGILFK